MFVIAGPFVKAGARRFLRQDGDMVNLQNEGLKYDPALDDLRRDGRFIEFLRARKLDQRLAQRIY